MNLETVEGNGLKAGPPRTVQEKLRKKRVALEITHTGTSLFNFSFGALETNAPFPSGF